MQGTTTETAAIASAEDELPPEYSGLDMEQALELFKKRMKEIKRDPYSTDPM